MPLKQMAGRYTGGGVVARRSRGKEVQKQPKRI
jgi:hypothetical protein